MSAFQVLTSGSSHFPKTASATALKATTLPGQRGCSSSTMRTACEAHKGHGSPHLCVWQPAITLPFPGHRSVLRCLPEGHVWSSGLPGGWRLCFSLLLSAASCQAPGAAHGMKVELPHGSCSVGTTHCKGHTEITTSQYPYVPGGCGRPHGFSSVSEALFILFSMPGMLSIRSSHSKYPLVLYPGLTGILPLPLILSGYDALGVLLQGMPLPST